jgi:cation:H+ antiporter
MEEHLLDPFYDSCHWLALAAVIVVLLGVLAKAADRLVNEAVVLSERAGLPKVVIGATIVSLGTTSPEAAVSVLAALQGEPGLALGNAVGSIICDTGLILGLACLISPPKLPRQIVNRQGWLQLASGILLVGACMPWQAPSSALVAGGELSQITGFVFLALLVGYLWLSIHWARQSRAVSLEEFEGDKKASSAIVVAKLIVAVVLVVAASWALVPAVSEAATRVNIPEGVIAATLVAFGTSLPELVTAVVASRRGHGDLAVGNIIGADILNVLFVAGASAAVTPTGLDADPVFFRALFPAMLFVLVVFRVGTIACPERLPRWFGFVLLAAYAVGLAASLVT